MSVLLLFSFAAAIVSSCTFSRGRYDYSWTSNRYIAHACGAVNNRAYTNSKEALSHNYDIGHRVFEADLIETDDGDLVCWHGWTTSEVDEIIPESFRNRKLTTSEFLDLPLSGDLHTMDFDYLVRFMATHKDMYLVTDTKSPDSEITLRRFEKIVDIARSIDPSVLDRIIPQIYYNDMLEEINRFYDWKSVIYTTYLLPSGTMYSDFVEFCAGNGIKVIAAYPELLNDELIEYIRSAGIMIYVFTVNSPEEQYEWDEKGISGYYTDILI